MKQIQEWLGHASFMTTADIYSHLDYSSKIQAASAIAGALDGSDKKTSAKIKKEQIEKDILKKILNEMGFSSIEEYIKATCEEDFVQNNQKDFSM